MMSSEDLREVTRLPGIVDEENLPRSSSESPIRPRKAASLANFGGDSYADYDVTRDVRFHAARPSRFSSSQYAGGYDQPTPTRAPPPSAFECEPDEVDEQPFSKTYSTPLAYLCGAVHSQKFRESLILMAVLCIFGSIFAACLRGRPPELYVYEPQEELPKFVNADQVANFGRMWARIVDEGVSSEHSLRRSEGEGRNARHAALAWLVTEDERAMDSHDDGFLARYALAVLWFETNGPFRKPGDGLIKLDDYHEEDLHEGYDSDAEGMRTADHEKRGSVLQNMWVDDRRWMTAAGVCQWKGVTCRSMFEPPESDNDGSEARTLRRRTPDGRDEDHEDGAVTALSLPSNGLSGTLPPEIFTALKSLHSLDLSDNNLSGVVASAVVDASSVDNKGGVLDSLSLSNNNLEGSLPPGLGGGGTLKRLDLHNNFLNGTLPTSLGDPSSALEYVFLEQNDLKGTIPPELFRAPSRLRELSLRDNGLSGPVPEVMVADSSATSETAAAVLMPLENLRLDHNSLTGSLPTSLGLLQGLTQLHLFRNKLKGTLPPSWSELRLLTDLYLDHNNLDGHIPPQWGSMVRLRELYLGSNALTGPVNPVVFSGMKDLEKFMVGGNRLGGSLTREIGDLSQLRWMGLEDNDFYGNLPTEMGSLENLELLRINGNRFSIGAVPSSVCALTNENSGSLRELLVDCNINCTCCIECV